MVFVRLTFCSPESPLDPFNDALGIAETRTWRKGEPMQNGQPFKEHVLSVNFPDSDSWNEALPSIEALLLQKQSVLERLSACCNDIELCVGVTVGEERSFAPSLDFPPPFMQLLAQHGIKLTVNAYPTSDE